MKKLDKKNIIAKTDGIQYGVRVEVEVIDFSEKEFSQKAQKWFAFILGLIAIASGLFYYETLTWTERLFNPLWFLHDEDRLIFSLPGLTHGIVALFLLAPLYIRKMLKYRNVSPVSVVFLVTNVFLFASWAQLAMGFKEGFSNTIVTMGILAAILLSWLGIRAVSGFCWLIVVFLCGYNMVNGAEMLSHWGIVFLVCSIISIWLQTKVPLDAFFSMLKNDFAADSIGPYAESIKDDIRTSIS